METENGNVDVEVPKIRENVIFKPPPEKKKKNSQDEKLRQRMDEAFSILKTSAQKEDNIKDDCDIYGELLATKLRKMDERTRDIAMNRIDNMIFEIKMNPPLSYENQYRSPVHQTHHSFRGVSTLSSASPSSSQASSCISQYSTNAPSPQPQAPFIQRISLSQPPSPYSQAADSPTSDSQAGNNDVNYTEMRTFYEAFGS